jgi:hypothetical protein
MAKIIKVASSTSTPRIANQFRTSRNSSTNPFKYQSFEGNTLDISAFADVFESSAIKETNKVKLIAASVAGCMHKIRTSITEPIVNFVKRVCGSISSAWDYAKNTNVSDLGIVKNINNGITNIGKFMSTPIDIPGSDIIDGAIDGIKTHISSINGSMLDLGKDIGSKWSALVAKVGKTHTNISSDMSVSELETMWKSEIASANLQEVA